ncbi:MAG: methyltransferase domain-containing protein [Pseudomonadota bacterium]
MGAESTPDLESAVAEHYTTEALLSRIRSALSDMGADPDAPRPEDLKPVDEFHTGGIAATEALLTQLAIAPETRVLDLGAGLGGTARHIAHRYGASVIGIDLTPVFVETATALSALVSLGGRTRFLVASALEVPIPDATMDLVTLFHVGMNIEDKAALMVEAARVLAPGGRFALFDVMRMADGALMFPVPWAERAELSRVEAPGAYRAAAAAAGLAPVVERNRIEFALAFFETVFARIAEHGPPPLGIHLLMRETAPLKIGNYVEALKLGRLAPVEMIFAKPG